MTGRRFVTIGLLLAGAAIGAYAATLATRTAVATLAPAPDQATEALLTWLDASDAQRDQLRQVDPTFARELHRLRAEAQVRRLELAAMLSEPDLPEASLMQAFEATLAADNALERRVAQYLLAVRKHLTPDQQQRLFGLCAERVGRGRGAGGAGWGRGFGRMDATATQPAGPMRLRGGRGEGRGPGPHGDGFRRGAEP